MDQLNALLTVVLAGLLLSASPGPSMAYVLSRSVQFGRTGGFASSLGLAFGGMLHALFAALGLSMVAVQFPWLLQVIKYVGAAYLCFLAYDSLSAALQKHEQSKQMDEGGASGAATRCITVSRLTFFRLFKNGALIELSNPKTIIFFLSFMPQFVEHHSPAGMFLLSSLIPITAVPADLIAIFAGGLIAARVATNQWLIRAINFGVAVVLFGIALGVVFL